MNLVSAPASAKVLIKYRARRFFNQLSTGFVRKSRNNAQRGANARKGTTGWISAIFLSGFILFQSSSQSHQIIQKTEEFLGHSRMVEGQIASVIVLEMLLLFFTALLLNISSKELATLILLFLESILRTVFDTGVRLVVSASTLRNFQAVTSIIASASLIFVMSISMTEKPALLVWSAGYNLDWLKWTPIGFFAQAAADSSLAGVVTSLLILVLQIAFVYLLAVKLILHLLRFGIVSGSTREGLKHRALSVSQPADKDMFWKSILSPLQLRELKLLARDRNFMVQTLVLPIFITGMQFFLQRTDDWTAIFQGSFTSLAAVTFGAATYSLMFSAFEVLNSEGKSLWILYTFPNRLENMLREKVYLWLGVALLYPVVLFGTGIYLTGLPSLESSILIIIVLLGILIYGTVAACFGVFNSDPLAEDPRQRVRLNYTTLYIILAGFYSYAIFAKSYWDKLALLVLSALMSLSLFQKARDHLPYLLDPTESPKPNVSLSDGLIAALIFFVIQGISTVLLTMNNKVLTGEDLLFAFSIAGAITFVSLRLIYWQKKTSGVPRIFGDDLPRAVGYGVISGVLAGAIGIGYLALVSRYGFFSAPASNSEATEGAWWMLALAVVAAPLFEEFIFRGIIFKGLLRTWTLPTAALASSAIFAIVHPPDYVVPVFCLAVVVSYSYAKTNLLITPMIAHAIYNFVVMVYQP